MAIYCFHIWCQSTWQALLMSAPPAVVMVEFWFQALQLLRSFLGHELQIPGKAFESLIFCCTEERAPQLDNHYCCENLAAAVGKQLFRLVWGQFQMRKGWWCVQGVWTRLLSFRTKLSGCPSCRTWRRMHLQSCVGVSQPLRSLYMCWARHIA